MSNTKEKTAAIENEELKETEVTLELEDDNDPYTTQIKATKKDKRRFDEIAAELGLQTNDAFVALLAMFYGNVDTTHRKPELERFKKYLTSALQMFIDAIRYGETVSQMAEDRVRARINAQAERIKELEDNVIELQAVADHAKETETKLADARRQIENLTIQVEAFRQINDDLQEKAGNVGLFRDLEEKIREQEKQIAVLEKEKEMKDEVIAVLRERLPQTERKEQQKGDKTLSHAGNSNPE